MPPRRAPGSPRPQPRPWRGRVGLAVCADVVDDVDEAQAALDQVDDGLRAVRRTAAVEVFAGLLAGQASLCDLSGRLTDAADRCIALALEAALAFAAARGPAPPGRCGVVALGKRGSREMTLGSDLDLLFVYDSDHEAAAGHFDRVAKTLMRVLTWGAACEALYEVDMRLRPHGDDGPLAVPLSGFRAYYRADCWTWELQALTRARFVAGDAALGGEIGAAIGEQLARIHTRAVVADDAAAMRALMQAERPPKGEWDQKRAEGGLIDIEFIAQSLQLDHAEALAWTPGRRTDEAIQALCGAGVLSARDSRFLLGALGLYAAIQHVQAAVGHEALDGLCGPVRQALLRRTGASSLPALLRRVRSMRSLVRARFEDLIGLVEEPSSLGTAA